MKLLEAEIDGFGQLYGKRIPLDASVIIVYGPNEAGKSTMFGFIRSMLYGFAKRGQAVERQEPVNGGKHGGRLFFVDQKGNQYVLERYAADGSGKLKLRGLGSFEKVKGQFEGKDGALKYEGDVSGASNNKNTPNSRSNSGEQFDQFTADTILTQAEWERSFLGGVSERLFRQLFAVTLTELQEVGALSGDELGRYLYQAGWDSGKAIAAAEKKLMVEMEALFKPRGTNQQINQQLKTLDELDTALRKRTDAITAYNELTQLADDLEHSLRTIDAELPLREARQLLMSKACSVRPLWMRKQKLLMERQAAAYPPCLTSYEEKSWEDQIRQRTERRDEVEQYRQKVLLLELQLQTFSYDKKFIHIADETEQLLQTSESMRMLKLDSAELEAELRENDDAIARLVSSIAPEWTERQLREFHVTVADRDYVRSARQQETEIMRTEERFAAELDSLKQQERDAAYTWEEAEHAIEREAKRRELESENGFELLPRTREALKGAWNALDAALREWELERVRAASIAGAAADDSKAGGRGAAAAGRGGAGPMWAGAAGAGGAALALGFAALSGAAAGEGFGAAGMAALALAVAALVFVVAALMRSRSVRDVAEAASGDAVNGAVSRSTNDAAYAGANQSDGRTAFSEGSGQERASTAGGRMRTRLGGVVSVRDTAAGEELRARELKVFTALTLLVREPKEAAAVLIAVPLAAHTNQSAEHKLAAEQARTQLRAAVDTRLEALQISQRLIDNKSEHARRVERLRAVLAERSEAAAAAAQTKQAAARQWAGWLAARALPASMSPSAALEAFELAEQAVQRLHQYDRLAAKKSAIDKQLVAFASQAAALCECFEEASRQLAADPALALRLLHAETRRHAAAELEAHRIEARREELLLAQQSSEARLQELQAELAAQMIAAGLNSEAEYELALEHRRISAVIDMEISQLKLEITAGMSEQRIAELEQLFAESDEQQLQSMHEMSLAELTQLEQQKQAQLEQRGRLQQSLDHLLSEEDQQRLITMKEMTLTQLEADAERFAVLSISAALIRRTKRVYEEERQPVVLRKASQFIDQLTNGKYNRVLTTPGEPGIRLESSERRLVDSGLLSRGTAEQLYLAMRFALAEEASQTVKLPLLLDDVFVNFDRGRLQAVTKLIAELSNDRQIIVMTCHEHVRDSLLKQCPSAMLIQM